MASNSVEEMKMSRRGPGGADECASLQRLDVAMKEVDDVVQYFARESSKSRSAGRKGRHDLVADEWPSGK